MWNRREVKTKGKEAMRRNYWKSVLVAMIFSLIAGGTATSSFGSGFSNGFSNGFQNAKEETSEKYSQVEDLEAQEIEELLNNAGQLDVDLEMQEQAQRGAMIAAVIVAVLVFLVVFFVLLAIGIALDILIINPAKMGVSRFFLKNQTKNAEVKEVLYGFDHNWKNVINVLFFYDLFVFLWSLLFVIPGIIKAYEYRMIPYLVAENTQITREEAFALSKQMMKGQKWKAFVLDLSFLGWYFLSLLPLEFWIFFTWHRTRTM